MPYKMAAKTPPEVNYVQLTIMKFLGSYVDFSYRVLRASCNLTEKTEVTGHPHNQSEASLSRDHFGDTCSTVVYHAAQFVQQVT